MANGQPKIHIEAHPDQLVVDLSQLDWTLEELGSIKVHWSSVIKNHNLRLALVSLENVSVPADYLGAPGESDLNRLISYLHDAFKRVGKGEELIIGKNRIVGSVVGSPYTGGGRGLPQPFTAAGTGP